MSDLDIGRRLIEPLAFERGDLEFLDRDLQVYETLSFFDNLRVCLGCFSVVFFAVARGGICFPLVADRLFRVSHPPLSSGSAISGSESDYFTDEVSVGRIK